MNNGSHEISLNFKSYYVIKDERIDSIFAAFCMMVNFQAGVGKRFISNSDIVQHSTIYRHLLKLGGVLNIKIDQELRNSARKASSHV